MTFGSKCSKLLRVRDSELRQTDKSECLSPCLFGPVAEIVHFSFDASPPSQTVTQKKLEICHGLSTIGPS
jgi:hypothetical protein